MGGPILCQARFGKKVILHGSLEMMVQACTLRWAYASGDGHVPELCTQQVLLPPSFGGSTDAGSQFRLIQGIEPLLALEELMAHNVELLILSLAADLHGANGRVKNEIRLRVSVHNKRFRAEETPVIGPLNQCYVGS
jgi:hypothetical protein